MAISKILAATDFSAPAQRAVNRAALLARHFGARLQLIHSLPAQGVLDRLLNRHLLEHGQMVKGAEHAIQKSCDEIGRLYGIDATWAVVFGAARVAIVDAVSTFGADLLVIGARGENESAFREPSWGGTALKLVAQSSTLDLAIGNIFGSNAFNMCVLLAMDLAYVQGPVLTHASPGNILVAQFAILSLAIGVLAVLARAGRRTPIAQVEGVLIVLLYIGNVWLLAAGRGA